MSETEKPNQTELNESDAPAAKARPVKTKTDAKLNRAQRFKIWFTGNKKLSIPLSILVLVLIILAVPITRYSVLGLFIKRDLTVYLIDNKTNNAVYGGYATLDGKQSSVAGQQLYTYIFPNVSVGKHTLEVGAPYYKTQTTKVTVNLGFSNPQKLTVSTQATGRLISARVVNKITGKAVQGVSVKAGNSVSKTDYKGDASLVVDPSISSADIELTADGYNDQKNNLSINPGGSNFFNLTITPTGKVYFLSKLSGKVDIVKTNLDGSNRETVLAGTGKEDDQNTVLLASRDWKYLALLSRRAGNSPSLYLIDTSDDSLTTIDQGDVNFQLLGWSDDYFTYEVSRNLQPWQPKASSIKSYNAKTRQLNSIDSTNATGSSNDDANYETYVQPILLDNQILFAKNWYQYPGYVQVSGKTNTLNSIKPDGTGKKIVKSIDASQGYFSDLAFHSPNSVYIQISHFDNTSPDYYEFNGSGLTQKNNLSEDDIFKSYPTYLYSPDGNATFWSEPRDGKNTLFTGDEGGQNAKQIATLSEYNTYGWFTDDYLLVSKNSSELYIMPKDGSQSPVKISDYHKPAQTFNGYGGGYGGL